MPALTVSAAISDRSLVSLATVKAELGITDTDADRDAMLTRWIVEQSDAICETCGVAPDQAGRRTFLSEEIVISYRAQEIPPGLAPAPLVLPWRIPLSVDTVTVDSVPLIVADDLEIDPLAGLLWRINADGERMRWGRARIIITGTAGWALADMPAALSSAVVDAVRYRWYASTRGDPLLRSFENPDVEKLTYMDSDKVELINGLPKAVADRLGAFTNLVIA